MDAGQLKEQVDQLFGKRTTLNLLWQEISDHFYVERGDFAYQRFLGQDFAAHSTTSYPFLVRRELGNTVGTMLRNEGKPWFHQALDDPRKETIQVKRWLQWFEEVQRRAMYDRLSGFHRAAPEADHDYATYGNAALSIRLNRNRNGLLFRTWHLRDVVWQENAEFRIGLVGRKWKPTARQLAIEFGTARLPQAVKDSVEKSPYTEYPCYHIVCESDMYDGAFTTDRQLMSPNEKKRSRRFPWVSVYMLADEKDLAPLEAIGIRRNEYAIPRWATVSGSQYGHSPCTTIALPEGRLLQAMTRTILEAGEKAVYPPLIATENAVRSDVAIYAGGITWVDEEYDERLGQSLRTLEQDLRGMPVGKDLLMDSRSILRSCFFLDKITMPTTGPEMTAYEVGQRIQQYIRDALPLFGPMEFDYNGQVCDLAFGTMLDANGFGSPAEWPQELRGAEVQFRYESPLHDLIEAQKGQKLAEFKQLVAQVIDIDPGSANVVDAAKALRDAAQSIRVPAEWIHSEVETDALNKIAAQKMQEQQQLQNLESSSKSVANLAAARAQAQPAPV